MKKNKEYVFFIFIIYSIFFLQVPSGMAEEVKVTTYYPSPQGDYKEIRVSSNAYLATQGGNVGIGTTTPIGNLDITRDSDASARDPQQFIIKGAGTNESKRLIMGYDTTANYASIQSVQEGVAFKPLVLQKNGGNVGIGTSSPDPQYGLDVQTSFGRGIRGYGTLCGVTGETRGPGAPVGVTGETDSKDGVAFFGVKSFRTDHDYDNDPRVYTYLCAGSKDNKIGVSTNGDMWAIGDIHARSFPTNSDVRQKKDIATIPNALERVSKLRGVAFRWKDAPPDSGLNVGLIAQEVEKEFPETVSADKAGMKSVAYANLVGPLVEAIKELKVENEKLKQRLDKLESSNQKQPN